MKLQLWALLALAACVCARTAQRQQPITAQITSLSDKDARRKAMTHPAFANAGQRAGTELWRIKNFEPVAVPQSEVGKFYKGDSYVVLKTTSDKRNNLSWDIFYWIGSESTQDESGAAAILTVGLDDKFGGAAVQHREVLGQESPQFAELFKPAGIKYLDGGHASGFNHVTTNAGAEKRLLQIKGKRNVRVRQVDPLIASMNKGDVFILDINQDIYVFVGDKARNVERLKAISVANQVRDQDHRGRGRVEIIDQYSPETDYQKFFTALGSGARDTVPEESAGGDDQTFEKSEEQSVTLSEVSDSSGKVKVTALSKPLKQEQLKPQECYILDTVSGSIYVWVGKQATEKEKTEAMAKAQQSRTSKNYPAWVKVEKILQNTETAVFKQYFQSWRDTGMSHSRIVRSVDLQETRQDDENQATAFRATRNNENVITFQPIDQFDQKVLDTNNVYVVDADNGVFVWVGSESDAHKAAIDIGTAFLAQQGLEGDVVVFKQGLEPVEFVQLFEEWDNDMWLKQRHDAKEEFDNEIDT